MAAREGTGDGMTHGENPQEPRSGRRAGGRASNPVPPFGYYAMARSNLESAKRIDSTHGGHPRRNTDTALQFLFGWSAEGYLKAYLRGRGVDDGALKGIGHDLRQALDRATALGLALPWLDRVLVAVEILSPGHKVLFYRYLPNNPDGTDMTFGLILPDLAFDALDALDEAVLLSVRAEINADEQRQGRAPTLHWHGVGRPPDWRPR